MKISNNPTNEVQFNLQHRVKILENINVNKEEC